MTSAKFYNVPHSHIRSVFLAVPRYAVVCRERDACQLRPIVMKPKYNLCVPLNTAVHKGAPASPFGGGWGEPAGAVAASWGCGELNRKLRCGALDRPRSRSLYELGTPSPWPSTLQAAEAGRSSVLLCRGVSCWITGYRRRRTAQSKNRATVCMTVQRIAPNGCRMPPERAGRARLLSIGLPPLGAKSAPASMQWPAGYQQISRPHLRVKFSRLGAGGNEGCSLE